MTTDKEQQIDELVNNQMRHHRRPDDDDSRERMMLQIRNILNIVFMILAVVGAIVYVKFDIVVGGWLIGAAVVVMTFEVAIRLFKVR